MEKDLGQPSSKRILFVEDDIDTCEVLTFLFREYELAFAHTLESAHPLIDCQHFDLYLLDNWLPDGSGIELCKKIRSRKPESPIIFASAVALPQQMDEAHLAGANRYLVKPYEPDVLKKIVKELINES